MQPGELGDRSSGRESRDESLEAEAFCTFAHILHFCPMQDFLQVKGGSASRFLMLTSDTHYVQLLIHFDTVDTNALTPMDWK